MIKKVLIIGYGSIGKKHHKVLKKINNKIRLIILRDFNKNTINQIVYEQPDLSIISTPTSLHFKYLKILDSILNKKIILVEKPIFEKKKIFKANKINKNKILIGYNLRFHPIINYLKRNTIKNNLINIRCECYSYLPNWRKKNYKNFYSAKKNMGGGVALDLSHEIDYIQWIFGSIKIFYKKKTKISKLNITSDDTFILIGKVNNTFLSINLNFTSHIDSRKIILDYNDKTINCDLIDNKITFFNKKNKRFKILNFKNQNSFENMHKDIFNKNYKNFCTMNEAINVLSIIK